MKHAINASGIDFNYLGTRSNPYSDTLFMLNIAKNCLKSNHLKMMLEDLAFHFDFLLKKVFQKEKIKIVVHSNKENKKIIGKELKKMITSLRQTYENMKSENLKKAPKSNNIISLN